MTRRAAAGFYYCNTPIHETDVEVELLASAVRAAGGAGVEVASDLIEQARALMFVLNVAANVVPTTLDVVVQAKVGNLWFNLFRFTQIGAATPIKAGTVKRLATTGSTVEVDLAVDPAVGTGFANNEKAEWLGALRVKWAIVGTSYTFGVTCYPIR